MALIPYFKPRYSAFTWRCQLCGAEGESEEFVTERIRGGMMRAEQGDAVFCKTCHPFAQELVSRIQEYRSNRLSDVEREIEAELSDLVPKWVEERSGKKAQVEAPAEPRRRGRPPKYSAEIPMPNGAS